MPAPRPASVSARSATLFVKVTAPASASIGAIDTTTITATTTGAINAIAAPAVASATDSSTVITSEITLVKTQALDAACDGHGRHGFQQLAHLERAQCRARAFATRSLQRMAARQRVSNVVINDTTPAFTVYDSTVAAAASAGSITEVPANGAAGSLKASVGALSSAQSATLTFGVRITP